MAEFENYVDGGTLCSNLCDHALAKIRDFCKQKGEGRIGCVVSVGSGIFAPEELGGMDAWQYLTSDSPWDNPENGQKMVMKIITLQLSANVSYYSLGLLIMTLNFDESAHGHEKC